MLDEDKQAQKPSARPHGRGTSRIAQPAASVLLWAQVGFLQAKVELQRQRPQNSAETRCPFPESRSPTLCCAPPNTGRPLMSWRTCPLATTQHSHCQWTELADLFLHVGSGRCWRRNERRRGQETADGEDGGLLPLEESRRCRWRPALWAPQYYETSSTVRGGAELQDMGGKQLVWEHWFPEPTLRFVNRQMCSPRYQNLYKAKLVWKLRKFTLEPRVPWQLLQRCQTGRATKIQRLD